MNEADPRLTAPLAKPGILRAQRMALTFVPDDPDAPPYQAQIDIPEDRIAEMLTTLRMGKVRLQIVSGFGRERSLTFENGAELFFFLNLAERFVHELPA